MNRNKPFTEYERQLAMSIISKRIALNGKQRNITKLEKWESAAKEFNNSQNIQQTVSALRLKKFWANYKTKSRAPKRGQCTGAESEAVRVSVEPLVEPTMTIKLSDSDVSTQDELIDDSELTMPSNHSLDTRTKPTLIEDMKIKLMQQQYDHNDIKFKLELSHLKRIHEMDIQFRKQKYELILNNLKNIKDTGFG